MRLKDSDSEIRQTDPHRHKFADALTEYAYDRMDAWAYGGSGDVDCPTGWFARIGDKRIIRGDDSGFVWVEKFADKRGREAVYYALELVFWAWSEEDVPEDAQTRNIERAGDYLTYCYVHEANNLESLTYDEWLAQGRPRPYPT
jgi:hypothetical protein